MTTNHIRRARTSERGEGMLKLVITLGILVLGGYLAIQNVPTYFSMQNFKHELSELARGSGVQGIPLERVQPQVTKLAQSYEVPPSDVKVEPFGNRGIKITLNTHRTINLIVTEYDWHISEVYQQQAY